MSIWVKKQAIELMNYMDEINVRTWWRRYKTVFHRQEHIIQETLYAE